MAYAAWDSTVTTGSPLTAAMWNDMTTTVNTLAAVSTFYTDSGVANSYVLAPKAGLNAPAAYYNGMTVKFMAGNANTGGSTIVVGALTSKAIKKADGTTNLSAGDIPTDSDTELRYDGTVFRLVSYGYRFVKRQVFITSGTYTKSPGVRAI